MPIVKLDDIEKQTFPNGATNQAIIGDDEGSTPFRVGVQVSTPGYSTGAHIHFHMEVVRLIEGTGVTWIEVQGNDIPISPGTTLVRSPGHTARFQGNWHDTTPDLWCSCFSA